MDVLFTLGMLGLMVVAIIVLGRSWPRSSRAGGYRAGRGHGAPGAETPGSPPGAEPADAGSRVPEEDGVAWRWRDGSGGGDDLDHRDPPDHRGPPDGGSVER